jgi:hypothetical protein
MPGVRHGQATLRDELRLADAYGRVWVEIDSRRTRWEISADPALPEIAFPPLWLLSALDRVADAAGPGSICHVRAQLGHSTIKLTLDAPGVESGRWMTPALDYRMRVGLRTVFGDAAKLELRGDIGIDAPSLAVTLPLSGARVMSAEPASTAVAQ